MAKYHLYTSESVTEGHPDKVADQISDAIVDAAILKDPGARVAAEVLVTKGKIILAGEIGTSDDAVTREVIESAEELARQTVYDIGYTQCALGMDADRCSVENLLSRQSPEIAAAVEHGGAGDQGMMYGYACRETRDLMPLPIQVAHQITKKLADIRRSNPELGLSPDGKSQMTVAYENGRPARFETVVISAQHIPERSEKEIDEIVREHIIKPVIDKYPEQCNPDMEVFINPSGSFIIGGPEADTGLTGRKIIVDTYGAMARHGGGSFSGKDPTKVDRSAAYAARQVAKSIVQSGLAEKCEVRLAYAIGKAEPVAVGVDTFGTSAASEDELEQIIKQHFDLTPLGIIRSLDLRRPIYKITAKNGHFGHPEFPWEKTVSV